MGVLDDIRHAAFELRQTDPQEAVRVLRRAAQQGGEAEVLARGALGELYLDEFGDLDGAEHEFRRVLQLAPGLTAAEIGLARTRAGARSEEHTSELQSRFDLVCRLLLEKKNTWRPSPGSST